ncbi:MAG: transcriptional repressor LexA [Planctomycetaceae bacterium]|nr:transcriptional repressor LexA [Planctomycetaceae bacterium]
MIGNSKKPSLTRRQREIYEFLRDKIVNRGYGPTVREIGVHFNIRSPNGVMCHLKALERKGLISREQNMSRAIQLADAPQNRLSVSLIGTAIAGRPIQASVSSDESVSFGSVFDGNDICCLRIEGHAFSPLNISDGDYLIINREAPIQSGCTVVALDDRHSVVLCNVQEGSNQLVPAIPGAYATITRQVLGVVSGVVRRFKVPQKPEPVAPPEPQVIPPAPSV